MHVAMGTSPSTPTMTQASTPASRLGDRNRGCLFNRVWCVMCCARELGRVMRFRLFKGVCKRDGDGFWIETWHGGIICLWGLKRRRI